MNCLPNRKLSGSKGEAIGAIAIACGGLLAALNSTAMTLADDTATVVAHLRQATEDVKRLDDHYSDFWQFGFQERGAVWIEIGVTQLELADQEDAEITAHALPTKDHCLNCSDYEQFLGDLCASLVRAGRKEEALNVLKRHYKQSEIVYRLPMIARAEAQMGDVQAAKRTFQPTLEAAGKGGDCSCGPPGELAIPEALTYAAFTQLAISDRMGTRQTVDKVESLLGNAKQKDSIWAQLMVQLAFLESKLGDSTKGLRMLRDAQAVVTSQLLNQDWFWQSVAAASCRLEDPAGAQHALSKVSREHAGVACLDLAIFQWKHGDFDAATQTLRSDDGDDYRALVLMEIAKSQAKSGNYKSALATVAHLKNDLRRAQGTLEVAATMAERGNRKEARVLARRLDYPRISRFGEPDGTQFKFDDARTWSAPYEFLKGYGMASMGYGRDMDGDLLAAAVRCKVALDGPGTIAFTKDMNEFGWDVLKAAQSQASEGDVLGALNWAEKLSQHRRILAIIGAAEGHVDYRKENRPGAAEERRLGRRSKLAWFTRDRMFGEE